MITMTTAAAASALLLGARARAAEQCMTPEAFNAYASQRGVAVTAGALTIEFARVDATSWPVGKKSVMAELSDGTEKTVEDNPCRGIYPKIFGPLDCMGEPCLCSGGPCEGKVKQEVYNLCPAPGEETWADPLHSVPIFTSAEGTCTARFWFDPALQGYEITCGADGPYTAEGENKWAQRVDRISVLEGIIGDHPLESELVSAEFCFEAPEPGGDPPPQELEFAAIEDVTASLLYPNAVYPDEGDLSVGADDSEVYLKFQLGGFDGVVEQATLHLRALELPSAEGDGASVHAAAHLQWSEDTLTWATRPGAVGPELARIDGVTPGASYSLDVSALIDGPGAYALAVAPRPTDGNGVHFLSKEASVVDAPRLTVTVTPLDGATTGDDSDGETETETATSDDSGTATSDGDGGTSGDGNSGDPSETDSAGASATDSGPWRPPGGDDRGDDNVGCACQARARGEAPPLALLALLAIARRRRRTARRGERHAATCSAGPAGTIPLGLSARIE